MILNGVITVYDCLGHNELFLANKKCEHYSVTIVMPYHHMARDLRNKNTNRSPEHCICNWKKLTESPKYL